MSAATRTRRINIYINGKEVQNDIRSITAEMRRLENQTKLLNRDTKEYQDNISRIRQLKNIILEHNQALRTTQENMSGLRGVMKTLQNYWAVIMGTIGSFATLVFSVKRFTDAFAGFEDKLTDVMKTTGLTREQVNNMNESFKQIDTRLSQEQLLELAYVAGKLGIVAEQDILGFVRASNQIAVALAKDLGGSVEDTMNTLGKLVQLFGLKEEFGTEESLLKVGSAINSLGMASSANEKNIVNFTNRVASVGNLAKVSIADVLGLGATIDALAISSEVAATAYGVFMTKMAKNPVLFANLAGMNAVDFEALINTDANEAFIKVLESISSTEGGFTALSAAIGEAGLEGQRAIQVISGLAQQTDFLRSQQELSRKEFMLGTSILEEYNLKNNNTQAKLEKNAKALEVLKVELGEKLHPVLITGQSLWIRFINILKTLSSFVVDNARTIITLTSAYVGYKVALAAITFYQDKLVLSTIALKVAQAAKLVVDKLWISLVGTQIVLTDLFTRKIGLATAATRLFSVTLGMTGIPALIGLLAGAAASIGMYAYSLNNLKRETIDLEKEVSRLTKEKQESILAERIETATLVGVIQQLNSTSSLRVSLIKKLKENYPDLLGYLNAESLSNEELSRAILTVNQNITERIRLAALEARSEAMKQKLIENAVGMLEIEEKRNQTQKEFDDLKAKGIATDKQYVKTHRLAVAQIETEEDRFFKKMTEYQEQHQQLAEKNKAIEAEFLELHKQVSAQNLKIRDQQTEAYQREIEAVKELIQTEKAKEQPNSKTISGLNIQLAQLERKLQLTKAIKEEDVFSENSEKEEILAEKKRYAQRLTSKEQHEKNLAAIEIKYMQGRLETRQYTLEDRLSAEIKLQDAISNLNEKSAKEQNQAANMKLKKDVDFLTASNQLLKDFFEGKIQTETEYNKLLLETEIKFLQQKLDGLNSHTVEYLNIENQLYSKKVQLLKDKLSQEKALLEAGEIDEIEALTEKHEKKLKDLGLFGKDVRELTEAGLAALNNLTKKYDEDLNQIDAKRIKNYLDKLNFGNDTALLLMRLRHKDELEEVAGNDVKTKELQQKHAKEEIEFISNHVKKVKSILDSLRTTGKIDSLILSDDSLSDQELKVLAEAYTQLENALSSLQKTIEKTANSEFDEIEKKLRGIFGIAQTDLFGFSTNQWIDFFKITETGFEKLKFEDKFETIAFGLLAVSNATKSYFELLANYEERALLKTIKRYDAEKDQLKQKLDFGMISQEVYNLKVKQLDDEVDRHRAVNARKNAQREKMLAIFNATISGAVALVKTLDKPWLSLIVAAAVASQIALIASTPMPEIPGAETGGFLVQRAQDRKKFNARFRPNKRGLVNSPTVLVGENGSEYVIPNQGMNNPTLQPFLGAIEKARLDGNLATVNFDDIIFEKISQRFSPSSIDLKPSTIIQEKINQSNPKLENTLDELTEAVEKLQKTLNNGVEAHVSLYGNKGFNRAVELDKILKNNANL